MTLGKRVLRRFVAQYKDDAERHIKSKIIAKDLVTASDFNVVNISVWFLWIIGRNIYILSKLVNQRVQEVIHTKLDNVCIVKC